MNNSECEKKSSVVQAVQHPLACFFAAFRFLTILPISWQGEQDGKYFQGSLYFFAPIGGLIGLVAGAVYLLLGPLFPMAVLAAFMVIFLGLFSGFLHFDGLADTFDGFFSSRPRERILEIMRDSRIGAMGVIGIIGVMMLKFAALSSLEPRGFLASLCLMPIAGRAAIVLSMALLPYARKEKGLGSMFYSDNCLPAAVWTFLFLTLCSSLLGLQAALLIGGVTIATVLTFSLWCKRVIGGATGDTLGAVCEITEMSVAVSMTCVYSML